MRWSLPSPCRFFRLLCLIAAWLVLEVGAARAVTLSEDERAYLATLGEVSLCVDPDWTPFESINTDGQYVGIGADLLALVAQRTGVRWRLVRTRDWPESLEAARSGRCQVLGLLNETPDRARWLAFTRPMLVDDNILVTREEHPFIADLGALRGERMALPKGTSIEERMRRDYPHLQLIITDTEAQALALVSERKAEMTMRSMIVAAYTIKHEGWFNLKIAGDVPGAGNALRIGVRQELTRLRDILDKGVASIGPADRQQIVDRHITIQVTKGVDYGLIAYLVGVFALVLLTSQYWLRKLRRANDALRRSESALREAQAIAGLGSYVYVPASGTWSGSAVFDAVFGLSSDSVRTHETWWARMHPEDRALLQHAFEQVLQGLAGEVDLSCRIVRADNGGERWVHHRSRVVVDAGSGQVRLIGTIQDITERKRTELALQQAKALAERTAEEQRQFIAMLSHEVRTPLTIIDSALQVLKLRVGDPATQLSVIARIGRGTARLAAFFDNCLTADRLASERFTIQATTVDMEAVLESVLEQALLMSGEQRVELDVAPDLPMPRGDPTLLRVMLLNLVSNALKYAPQGTRVRVRAASTAGWWRLAVEDDGPGIAEEEIPLILRKYHRGQAARGTPGAGLGLDIVQRIAELHGGQLRVISKPGVGSVFVVEFAGAPDAGHAPPARGML